MRACGSNIGDRASEAVIEEPEIVGRRGEHATGRGLGRARTERRPRVPIEVVADREARDHRGSGHTKVESAMPSGRSTASAGSSGRPAGQPLDDLLEVREPLAGVAPPSPWRPSQVQRPVPPVGEAGRVAEHHPCGDRRRSLVIGQVGLGQIIAERPIQFQRPAVDQGDHACGEHRLGQGRSREHGPVVNWPATIAATACGHDPLSTRARRPSRRRCPRSRAHRAVRRPSPPDPRAHLSPARSRGFGGRPQRGSRFGRPIEQF